MMMYLNRYLHPARPTAPDSAGLPPTSCPTCDARATPVRGGAKPRRAGKPSGGEGARKTCRALPDAATPVHRDRLRDRPRESCGGACPSCTAFQRRGVATMRQRRCRPAERHSVGRCTLRAHAHSARCCGELPGQVATTCMHECMHEAGRLARLVAPCARRTLPLVVVPRRAPLPRERRRGNLRRRRWRTRGVASGTHA